MSRLWSDRWASAKSALLDRRPIARIPWSAIRRIGQSRLLSLTIVVPFLGSVILFNQVVVDLLILSPDLVRRWLHLDGQTEQAIHGIAHNLTLSRLYYVYFGLSFLGFGSSLFALFCPIVIKDHSSSTHFQNAEIGLASKPRVSIMMGEVARQAYFWDWESNEDQIVGFKTSLLMRRAGAPEEFLVLFRQVVMEVYAEWCRRNPNNDSSEHEDYLSVRGIPDPWKIGAAIAYPRHRPETFFADEMFDASYEATTRSDVLALAYMGQDNTKPVLRIWTVSFYVAGFGLLLIPTLQTFYSVLCSLIER